MTENSKKILVLGVGNILYSDEGTGVKVVDELEASLNFSSDVTLMDGGTLGTKLMGPIMESDFLIVVDAVLGDGPPGSIYRLEGDDLRKSLAFKNSLHQTDLVDTLIYCELAGKRPDAIIVGMEPFDYESMNPDLTSGAKSCLPDLKQRVLQEVQAAGGTWMEK